MREWMMHVDEFSICISHSSVNEGGTKLVFHSKC